mmetsp:Transcript_17345/g.20422  ORF Transcript_17345/g.20422 Transcript_17345/m.20422 type:complete len:96 (+) Transcript_17345:153-440(+)
MLHSKFLNFFQSTSIIRTFSSQRGSIEALFWLDQKMSRIKNAPRIPEKTLQEFCSKEGGVAGLEIMGQLGHKTVNKQFLNDMIDILDESQRQQKK